MCKGGDLREVVGVSYSDDLFVCGTTENDDELYGHILRIYIETLSGRRFQWVAKPYTCDSGQEAYMALLDEVDATIEKIKAYLEEGLELTPSRWVEIKGQYGEECWDEGHVVRIERRAGVLGRQ